LYLKLKSKYFEKMNKLKVISLTAVLMCCCFFYTQAQSYEKMDEKTWAYYDKGDIVAALANAQKALKQAQKEFGTKHSKTSEAMFTVALFLEFNNQASEAEKFYLDALEMSKQTDGEKSDNYVYGLEMVAGYYSMNANYEKSIEYYRKNLDACKNHFGVKGEEYAISLNNLGATLDIAGYYSEAVILLEQAATLIKTVLGENDIKTAKIIRDLGHAYSNAGDFHKSENAYKDAIAIWEKTGNKSDAGYADLLNQLGMLYTTYNKNTEAEKYLSMSLEMMKVNMGTNNANYGNALNNLAMVYQNTGKHDLSLKTYNESIEILKNSLGTEHPNYLSAVNNLAGLYIDMGQLVQATKLYEEVLETRKKVMGENSSDYAYSLNDLALVYEERGNIETAENYLLKALDIRMNLSGKYTPDYTTTLNNLAVLFDNSGRYDKSEAAHLECIELKKKVYGENSSEIARSMISLASLYDHLGNQTRALSYFTKSISILENTTLPDKKLYAKALNNFGSYYIGLSDYNTAATYFEKSLNIRKELYGENHQDYATGLYNLGLMYEEMGNSDKSIVYFEKSLAIYGNTIGKDNITYAKTLSNIGNAYSSLGKYAQAETYYKSALDIFEAKSGKQNMDYVNVLNNLSYLYIDMNKPEKAEPVFTEANNLLVGVIKNTISFMSEIEKEAYLTTVVNDFKAINSFYYSQKTIKPELAGNLLDNEIFTNGMLLGSERSMRVKIQNSKDEKLNDMYEKWLTLKKELAVNYAKPIDSRDQNLPAMETEANSLEKQLYQLSADFKATSDNENMNWKKIQENLADDEAFIEFLNFELFEQYLTGKIIYAAIILTKKMKNPEIIYLCNEKDLNRIIGSTGKDKNQFVNTLYANNRGAGATTQTVKYSSFKGDSLAKYLWNPVQPFLQGVNKIYMVQSGMLHQISFAALPGNQAKFLCQQYEINVLSSARFLKDEKSRSLKGTDANVFNIFGGIDYNSEPDNSKTKTDYDDIYKTNTSQIQIQDNSRGENWNYLAGTLEESNKIEQSAKAKGKQINLITGKSATEERFKQMNGNNSPDVLHIATHGFFFSDVAGKPKTDENIFKTSDNPLFRSGLLFAGANLSWQGRQNPEGTEDGILTAYEVSTLNLSKTRLVVLSACETGLGDIKGSEGVYGLQRAFKKAGVEYLIMSLWQVPDKETSEFMQLFYDKWISGLTVRQAFSQTQKEMSTRYAPYYWAAFVLLH